MEPQYDCEDMHRYYDSLEFRAMRLQRDELLAALKAMVASYDGIRSALTCKTVIGKLAQADAAIAKAEGR